MNINAKVLNKILLNKSNNVKKKKEVYNMTKWDLSQVCRLVQFFRNQYTPLHQLAQEISCNHINRCIKSIGQNPIPTHDKKYQKMSSRGELPPFDKEHL